jgi:L-fucose isomerase
MGYQEEAEGHNAIAAGFQGQRQWTDHFPDGDFMETILNTSFDWNGVREPFIFATENDCLNGVSMLWNHLLTNRAQMFSDIRTYWSPESVKRVSGKKLTGLAENGIIHLINSGSTTLDATGQQKENGKSVMKPFWEITEQDIQGCLENTKWSPANLEYMRGGGFSSTFWTVGEMPVTMSRINLIKGLGPVLQIAEGYTVELPYEISFTLTERTDPAWPTTWFAPKITGKGAFRDVYSVMNFWGANHGAISYGHIGKNLITLASLLRIPVAMHNVEEKDIFRPKVWSAFGTAESEGADFRACKNFGPLYR